MLGLSIGIIASALGAYGMYKIWLSFHKVVGIEPTTMRYIPMTDASNDSPPPASRLNSLNIPPALLNSLDSELKQQIQRLDNKVALYRQWQQQRNQEQCWQGDKVADSEANFVLDKLLNTHLKEALQNQHSLTQWQQQRQLIDAQMMTETLTNTSQSVPAHHQSSKSQVNEQQINQTLLQEIIDDIEARLDGLLLSCEQQHVHELQVMRRYLKQR